MKCHTSDVGCIYHACMSNDCQMHKVLEYRNMGPGSCGKVAPEPIPAIKTAHFSFACPVCGKRIRTGDIYLEDENGLATCTCMLPSRRLSPLKSKRKNVTP